jgi:hypothetical protein
MFNFMYAVFWLLLGAALFGVAIQLAEERRESRSWSRAHRARQAALAAQRVLDRDE